MIATSVGTPLCVDLDGTLVKSDLLFESFLLLIKNNWLYVLLCPYWLLWGGKAYLKQQIADRVAINPALLPYSQHFLSYLKEEKAKGRYIALVTATDKKIATLIADHIGIFSEVIASDGLNNLKGKNKREVLNQRFGMNQYDYAGNDKADFDVWQHAREAILVNPTRAVVRKSKSITASITQTFVEQQQGVKVLLKLLRVHQYAKNLLIFSPLIAGHLFNAVAFLDSTLAFIIFCLLASSAYLLNDLLDLEADRQHKTKCNRAFAAGDISISVGLVCAPLMFIAACLFALLLPANFYFALLSYYALTLLYSFYFKKIMLLDVFVLAVLYTLRIVAGIVAINSNFSPWFITFSIFIFLSLAFVKRYSELYLLQQQNKVSAVGRGYHVSDIDQLRIFGTISGYISVLVFALYIHSDNAALYQTPELLWSIGLILLYWISRIWMLATRGELHEDPVLFAIKDKVSWIAVFISGLIFMLATYMGSGVA